MKFTTPARRLLAAGAVSALAAGTLVATTATTASAAPIANEYLCDASTDFPLFLNSDIPIIAAVEAEGISAGFDVPAEFLEVANTVTVPTAVLDTLSGIGITRVDAPGFAGSFGPRVVGVDGVGAEIASATDNENGTSSFQADGVNAAFQVPAAGTYDVVSPTTITLEAKNSSGTLITSVPCVLAEGETAGSYGTVEVFKNESTSNAKPTKRQFKKGTAAAVRVKVSAPNEIPTGKVLLKKGTKTLAKGNLNDNGVVVLKTKALRVGKTKLKTVYKGDGYTKPSTDTVVVKVVR
jgi:hypothetical protein